MRVITKLSDWNLQQIGASTAVISRFANAELFLGDGNAGINQSETGVIGFLRNVPADTAGHFHAQTQVRTFVCLTADLNEVANGHIEMTQQNALCRINGETLQISKSTPNFPAVGQTTLILEIQ